MALQCGFNMLIINSPNQYVSTNVNLVMSFWFDEVLIQWCTTKDPNPCSARTCSLLPCKRNHRSIKFQWRSFCRLNIANNIKENKLNERSNNIAIHAHNSYSYNSPLEVWNHFIRIHSHDDFLRFWQLSVIVIVPLDDSSPGHNYFLYSSHFNHNRIAQLKETWLHRHIGKG